VSEEARVLFCRLKERLKKTRKEKVGEYNIE
jgi:hypothetical protein